MVKGLWGVLLALALTGWACAGEREVRYGPPAWWVDVAPMPAPPVAEAGAPLSILLNDSQTYFTDSGSQFYYAFAAKVLTADGLRPLGVFNQDWNPETETLSVHHLLIHRGEQTIDVLASDHFQVLQREKNLEQAAVDGRLTAALQVNGLEVGDVIDFAFTIDRRNPVLAGREGEELHLATFGTTARVRWRALWPEGRLMRWRTTPGLPALTPTSGNGGAQLVVDLQNVKSPALPEGAPLRFADLAGLELTGFATWGEVSQTLEPLFRNAAVLEPGSPVKDEAARIAAQTTDPVRRMALALRLVEEKTRYVFIGMNLGGYVPASADETWRRRFGDCKGKTVLLLALLNELGIKAEASLVNSAHGDGLDKHLPRLELFDHVLVRAEIGRRSYWLDGTRPEDGPPSPLTVPPYRWTLPLRQGGAVLERMVQVPALIAGGETMMTVDATAGLDAPMPVEVQLISQGDAAIALNRDFAGVSKADFQRTALKSSAKLYNWIDFKSADWTYDREQTVLTITLTGVGKDSSGKDSAGQRMFEVDHSGFPELKKYGRDEGQPADAPYALPFPSYERWTVLVKLPGGGKDFHLAGIDVNETVGGLELRRDSRIDHGVVVMDRSVRTLTAEITATEAAAATARAKTFDVGIMAIKAGAVKSAPHNPTSADDWVAEGDRLLRQGQYDEALRAFDAAGRMQKDSLAAIIGRASAYAAKKDYPHALEQYDLALRIAPPALSEGLTEARAYLLSVAGRREEALAALDTAVAASKAPAGLYAMRGEILHKAGQGDKALADLDMALKLDPDNADAHAYRAQIHGEARRWDAALPDLEAVALREAPRADPLETLAQVEFAAGRPDLAYALFDQAAHIDPFDIGALSGRVSAGERLGRFEAAVRDADRMAALGEPQPGVLNAQCWSRALWNRELDRALAFCDAALQKSPRAASILDSRAFVKFRLGQWDAAIADDDAALVINPKLAASLFVRGMAKLHKGDPAGGQADLDAAQTVDPGVAEQYAGYGVVP